jgi:hypothetical protein
MSTKVVAVISVICALLAGGTAWQQRRDGLDLKKQIASLVAELKDKHDVVQKQEKLLRELRDESDTYRRESAALRAKMSAPASPVVLTQDGATSPSSEPSREKREGLAKIFDDPKMKKVFRQQRILHLKQLYNDFVKERHLSSQKSEQFFDLLADGALRDMQDGVRIFNDDEGDGSTNGPGDQSSATETTGIERQLRTLLGDADYAAYQAYEKTTNDRMALAQIREQIGLAGVPLQDDQAKAMMQIMTEERSRTSATDVDPGSGRVRDRFAAITANGERYLEQKADLNRRILNRMTAFLSQEQYDALERFQEQQLEMEKIGVEMTRQLMDHRSDGETHSFTVTPAH